MEWKISFTHKYVNGSQRIANRARRERLARQRERNVQFSAPIPKRPRDDPELRDITQGDALNVAMEEIRAPRVCARTFRAAKARVGGDNVGVNPFRYNFHFGVATTPPPRQVYNAINGNAVVGRLRTRYSSDRP